MEQTHGRAVQRTRRVGNHYGRLPTNDEIIFTHAQEHHPVGREHGASFSAAEAVFEIPG
jgi:hypothetical protein